MTAAEINPYDAVAYAGHAFSQTHPGRLAVIAHAHGMRPAPPERMRVLELGCGYGANLVPMALQYPQGEYLGIDLSGSAIAHAKRLAEALALDNIVFEQRDIMDVTAEFGRFDYIIAHGVYSWVPQPVREKILALFGELLNPHGVGYLSYNALPGCRLRDVARDVMLYAVRDIADQEERAREARRALKLAAEASDPESFHGSALRIRQEQIAGMPDSLLIHDDLNPIARAFTFSEVVGEAARHGLQFLSEASFPNQFGAARGEIQKILARFPPEEVLDREQTLDLLMGRFFRETLFCHGDVALRHGLKHVSLADYHLAAEVRSSPKQEDKRPGVEQFEFAEGVKLAVDLAAAKAALHRLGSFWPQAVPYDALVARAFEDCAGTLGPDLARERERLDEALTAMFRAGLIDLRLGPLPLVASLGERPVACPLVRLQVEAGEHVTDRRHRVVKLEGLMMRRFVSLLDGSRDAAALSSEMDRFAADMRASGAAGDDLGKPTDLNQIETNLRELRRLALLCG